MKDLNALVAALLKSTSFEEAAGHTLVPMLDVAAAALERSACAGKGSIVRGMIHLRPSDGYRQLVVLDRGHGDVAALDASETRLPSMTAWRWVAQHRCAVSIDVNVGRIELDLPAEAAPRPEPGSAGGTLSSLVTQQRLLDRGATHVHVLPLRGPRGSVDGMISLEANCRIAVGQPFIWKECTAQLQLIADVAAPHLAGLPLRPAEAEEEEHDDLLPVVGASMTGLIKMLRVFAQQDETILLSGPTGVGKSRLARWCHERSRRRRFNFEVLDLSTVPEELQLGELFGWKKGAFTSALRDNPGALGRAQGGTLFIDEIDKLSLRAQAGLLYVLETRGYRFLGDSGGENRADVRFIVGTNANLQAAVREQRFREDLYYRINVLPVKLPSLADRADEIPLWARFMIERRHRERVEGGRSGLTAAAERKLLGYSWPGNLRQLDNIIRRAYTVAVMEHGGTPPRELCIEEEHISRALAYEEGEKERSLLKAIHLAAAAFVREAERCMAEGAPLDLDMADVFRSFVLAVAVETCESREEAFRLLGRENLVKNRNHLKVLRRELEKVDALCRALGPDFTSPFARLHVAGGEDP